MKLPFKFDANFEQCVKKAWEAVIPILDLEVEVSRLFVTRFDSWVNTTYQRDAFYLSTSTIHWDFFESRRPHCMFPSSKSQNDKTFGFHILGSLICPKDVKNTIAKEAVINKKVLEERYFNVGQFLKDLKGERFFIDRRCLRVWSISFGVNFEIHKLQRTPELIQSQSIEGEGVPTILVNCDGGNRMSLLYKKSPVKIRRYIEGPHTPSRIVGEVVVIDEIEEDGSNSSEVSERQIKNGERNPCLGSSDENSDNEAKDGHEEEDSDDEERLSYVSDNSGKESCQQEEEQEHDSDNNEEKEGDNSGKESSQHEEEREHDSDSKEEEQDDKSDSNSSSSENDHSSSENSQCEEDSESEDDSSSDYVDSDEESDF